MSTIVVETASAAMSPAALRWLASSRGTAMGMIAVRIAVEEAKAEVMATVKHSSRATTSGAPRPAACAEISSMMPAFSSMAMYVIMPATRSRVDQLTPSTAFSCRLMSTRASRAPAANARKPISRWKPSAPTTRATRQARVSHCRQSGRPETAMSSSSAASAAPSTSGVGRLASRA